jgi:hypothetical protein
MFRKSLIRQVRQMDGEVTLLDRVTANMANAAAGAAKDRVQAALLIRDTLDGRPSQDDAGGNVAPIMVNVLAFAPDTDE